MGIALSTLSAALPHPLQNLARWLHSLVQLEEAPRNGSHSGTASPLPATDASSQGSQVSGHRSRPADDERTVGAPRLRPLRGNWPFTVSQPSQGQVTANGPKPTATRSCPAAHRSFLCGPSGSSRDAFLASIASGTASQRSATTVRKVAHASGRLVIAGRMADVCAELDRMAASEALQA